MADEITIAGGMLRFRGYEVGRLSDTIPASIRGEVEELLHGHAEAPQAVVVEHPGAAILRRAGAKAQAGLVTLSELEAILRSELGSAE